MRLFKKTNIDFLKLYRPTVIASLVVIAIGLVSLVVKRGPQLGIDFTGGAQIILGFAERPDEGKIRGIVEGAGFKAVSVQRFDRADKNQVLVRVPLDPKEGRDVGGEVTAALTRALFPKAAEAGTFDLNLKGAELLRQALTAADPDQLAAKPGVDPKVEYGRAAESIVGERSRRGLLRSAEEAAATPGLSPAVASWVKQKTVAGPFILLSSENVGPQVGKDLRQKGLWAILLSWVAMLTYIAVRFRALSYGAGAVVALIHDTVVTLGFCSLFGVEIGLTEVAAFLALIGYSVNDTVVIYDRIRENLQLMRKAPLPEVVNRSVNDTLSRTFLTSALTFLTVIVLFLFGGETLRGFSFILVIGLVAGSYSTVFIASPFVITWESWRARRAATKAPAGVPAKGNGKPATARAK